MRGRRKVSHATQQQDRKRKRPSEQPARVDKPQSRDVVKCPALVQIIVDPDAYQEP